MIVKTQEDESMDIYGEAKRYVAELRALPNFLGMAQRKGRYLRQRAFTFAGTR